LVQEKLPLVIVNTGAENSNPVNQWWEDNRDQFLKAKYTFAGGVSVYKMFIIQITFPLKSNFFYRLGVHNCGNHRNSVKEGSRRCLCDSTQGFERSFMVMHRKEPIG
jgi:hypothetical protein